MGERGGKPTLGRLGPPTSTGAFKIKY